MLMMNKKDEGKCYDKANLEVVYENLDTGDVGHHLSLNSDESVVEALTTRLSARGINARIRLVAKRENGSPVVVFSDGRLTDGKKVACNAIEKLVMAAMV